MSLPPQPKNCTGNTVLIKFYIGIYILPFYIHLYVCMYTPVYMEHLQRDASCASCYGGQASKKWTGKDHKIDRKPANPFASKGGEQGLEAQVSAGYH